MSTYYPLKLLEHETVACSKILNIPFDAFKNHIGCLDRENNLLLIHYNPNLTDTLHIDLGVEVAEKILLCRGVIIDLDEDEIVCHSYGFNYTYHCNQITSEKMNIKYLASKEIEIDPTKIQFKIFYGGILVRLWKYKSKFFFSTHRKINGALSHYGTSREFLEIFMEEQSVLIDSNIPLEEGLVHLFLINDKDLLVDTRSKIPYNRIFYLESFRVGFETREEETEKMTQLITNLNQSATKPIFFPEILTIEEANNWITHGTRENVYNQFENYFKDFEGGETVIFNYENLNISIKGDASTWRRKIIRGKTNLRQAFYSLLSSKDVIPYGIPIEILKRVKENFDFNERNFYTFEITKDLYQIALTNLFFAVPIERLQEVLNLYDTVHQDMVQLIDFLFNKREELQLYFQKDDLKSFPGLHNKKNVLRHLTRQYKNSFVPQNYIFSKAIQELSNHWPEIIKSRYEHLRILPKKQINDEIIVEAQIILFVMNLHDDLLYSFLTLPTHYEKTKAARERK